MVYFLKKFGLHTIPAGYLFSGMKTKK